jgi:hypothetical protein
MNILFHVEHMRHIFDLVKGMKNDEF